VRRIAVLAATVIVCALAGVFLRIFLLSHCPQGLNSGAE
jgi:hypothetical protein